MNLKKIFDNNYPSGAEFDRNAPYNAEDDFRSASYSLGLWLESPVTEEHPTGELMEEMMGLNLPDGYEVYDIDVNDSFGEESVFMCIGTDGYIDSSEAEKYGLTDPESYLKYIQSMFEEETELPSYVHPIWDLKAEHHEPDFELKIEQN